MTEPETGRRWLAGALVPAVVAAVAVVSVLVTRRAVSQDSLGPPAAHTATAQVVRTTLRTTRQYYGTLDYGALAPIAAATSGRAYTWLPRPEAVIRQGERLYEVDGRAVPLLAGTRPMWRALGVGDPAGPDIAQLNTDLVALGYATGIAGNTTYDRRTRAAVKDWQHALGVPVTGVIDLGQVVFAAAPLRVASVAAATGAPGEPGQPLLSATAVGQVVELPVPVDQAYLIHRSEQVTVTMPDAVTRTQSTVTGMSTAASAAAGESAGAPPSNGPPAQASVTVTIRPKDTRLLARFSSAPVSVEITTRQARNVLAVPVSALLARPGGGYAVTVIDATGSHDVAVSTGLYSDTLVQVSGPGMHPGTTVAVPAS
jgi:multidrug efflux system membrane fusion protein